MDYFLYCLVLGIGVGAIYAMVALGYTLVYGIIKLINFAHGEFYMVGAYAGYGVFSLLRACRYTAGASPWLVMPLIVLTAGVAGAAIAALTEWVAYRPIRHSGRLAALLTAIGVSFLLQKLATFVEQGNNLTYQGRINEVCQTSIRVGSGGIRAIEFVYVGVSVVLMLVFWYVVKRTRFGKAMRATSQDMHAAMLMGIDVNAVIRKTFIAGGFFAGVAGALFSLETTITPTMGFMPGLNAFVAAVVGGIGSIPGAMLGGYVLGIVQYLVVWAGVPTGYKDIASFVLLIAVLVVRPQGILGRTVAEKV